MQISNRSLLIKKASSLKEIKECLNIREKVFVIGQNVPLGEERDGQDDSSIHYLLLVDNIPIGTTRVRFIEDYAKIERVAILENYQNKGYGKELMTYILSDLRNNSAVVALKLSAQIQVIDFYARWGFKVCSEKYIDAGIPHKDMILSF